MILKKGKAVNYGYQLWKVFQHFKKESIVHMVLKYCIIYCFAKICSLFVVDLISVILWENVMKKPR
jgi:hypothetical protein